MERTSVPAAHQSNAQRTTRLSPHVIAITSGKGGVGKSSIAVNLGLSLAKAGARVCILDADTGLANINILLGLTPKASLEHVLFGAKTIEEIMLDGPFGLKIIPGANGISECVSLHPRQQLRLTRELGRIENEFDFLLLDTAAGIAETTLDFIGSANQSLVVITPEPTSLTDAFSLIKLMQRRRPGVKCQVVVNMCANVAQAREVYHRFSSAVEKYIGIRTNYLGHLLRDESLRNAVTLQSPVALFPESDPSSRSFIRLADALKQAVEADPVGTGFTLFWQRQFRRSQSAPENSSKPITRAAGDERAYLSELKSRLLTLVAKADTPSPDLAATLDEIQRAYAKRFGGSAINPQSMIDELIAEPERNELTLRQLAERLAPWSPAAEQSVQLEPTVVMAEHAPAENAPLVSVTARIAPVHCYDEHRFGSQQMLLDLLQRQSGSGKTALELIEILRI
ncbi:MAG: cobyrinic acid ac-diamide synthase [Verrucomicrobiaceae bacterium]|nr:cobyrinic acid ac-diamide synthase [Verrucomicrobiaceae bacterium]